MLQTAWISRSGFRSWRLFFGIKLLLDLTLTGVFYFENSIAIFWRLSFIFFSLAVFLIVNYSYSSMKSQRNWIFHLLILDFLVSASYGYVYISGNFPNHLFVGITALAILMFFKNIRTLIITCILLLMLYMITMGSIDWYLYHRFDEESYFITCSFIVFAGIVSYLINFYQHARKDTMMLYEQLMQSHESLKLNALKTEEWAAAKERVRIARDIHDTVGHKLTALLVQMQAARKLSKLDSVRSEQSYIECEELIRSALQEVRLSVRAIRDEPIQSNSIQESLQKLAEEFTKFAKVDTVFEQKGSPVTLPGDLQLTVYRVVQESLTNAQKHGHAQHAIISLDYREAGFSLCIKNDGDQPGELQPGFGLLNLQERVREWQGEVEFRMEKDTDFAVVAQFPYPQL